MKKQMTYIKEMRIGSERFFQRVEGRRGTHISLDIENLYRLRLTTRPLTIFSKTVLPAFFLKGKYK